MADNKFRDFRGRDPIAREDVDPTVDDARDPLAELARLIGQRDRINELDRGPRHAAVETLDEPAPATGGADLAADDGYAEPDEPVRYADEEYVQPRLPDPHPSDRAYPRDGRDDERSPPIAGHYAEPADHYEDAPEDEPAYEPRDRDVDISDEERPHEPRYRDDYAPPPRSTVRQPPALAPQTLAPQSYADEDETHDRWDGNPDRQSDVAEDEYDDETPSRSRRGGVAVVLAMLGLVLVGAAGAFAYRAMFGGAILMPSLPPIIKANDGPTKIMPNRTEAQAGASNQAASANPGSPEKLVSREEQPVPIQPPNAPPRVVSTIPVLPAPGAAPGAAPGGALALAPVSPAPPKAAAPGQPAAATPAPAGSTEPKKVHTVTIRPDQMGGAPNVPAAVPAPAPPAAAARPRAPESVGVRPGPAPAPRAGGNAPLAIVPAAQGAAQPVEPPRSRVTHAEAPSAPVATAPAAPPSGGGYAVQVTAQRSETEAQTAFKSLQAKFPAQLGNRQPIIHRADLGDKGTYYRALVGPFASSEAAASMCSNLKAAGGSCLVQKN
jgi:sporulation related protein